MYEQVKKQKENKSRAVANSVAQKKSSVSQGFRIVDNRSETKVHRNLVDKIKNRQSVRQLSSSHVIQRDACLIPGNKNSPYYGIGQKGGVGPGEPFDRSQRFHILSDNFQKIGSVQKAIESKVDLQKDDLSGNILLDPKELKPYVAEVDHIVPKDYGGGNSELNAQVISGSTNASKGNTYPHGGYSGVRIYDPAQGKIYMDKAAAQMGGADLTTLNKNKWI